MRSAQLILLIVLIAVVACSGGQAPQVERKIASHNNLRVLKVIDLPQDHVAGFRFFHRRLLAGTEGQDFCEAKTSYDRRRDFPITILTVREHTVSISESYAEVNGDFDHKTIQIAPDDVQYLTISCHFKTEKADLGDVNRLLEGQLVVE